MNGGSVGIVKTEKITLALPESGFLLETGGTLPEVEVAFERYGNFSANGENVILVCHALSGDAHAAGRHSENDDKPGWWDMMIGPGKGIDTDRFGAICSNVLGGCGGTTGPGSINPDTGKPYGTDFPEITIGDMVRIQRSLCAELGIEGLYGVIGGSAGALQVLEWVARYPDFVRRAVCIAGAESLSAQALSFDIVARKIIMVDPSWKKGHYYQGDLPENGLSLARMIGHITYLSRESMERKFGRERRRDMEEGPFTTDFQVESYLNHQGKSFVERFDANSFLYITRAMSSFSLAERAESVEEVFRRTRSRFLVISVSSDWLYPAQQSRKLAEHMLRAGKAVSYCNLRVPYGHDSFLIENTDLTGAVSSFLSGPVHTDEGEDDFAQEEYTIISGFMDESGNILDLGCGNGGFLRNIFLRRGMHGQGVDIDFSSVIECGKRGVPLFQVDLDRGLGMIPDGFYDYAVLSRTLLEVHKPDVVLKEMMRVARIGIVSFPNFACWKNRLRLGLKGSFPEQSSSAHWYDTPDIHFLTLRDFHRFCRENGIEIVDIHCIPKGFIGGVLNRLGRCNLGTDRVVVKIAVRGTALRSNKKCSPVLPNRACSACLTGEEQ